jgi:hypothetical protein
MAFLVLHFFVLDAKRIKGAISFGFFPSRHGVSQKDAFALLSTVIVVAT